MGAAALVVAVLVQVGIPEPVAVRVAGVVSVEIPTVEGTSGILRTARIEQVVYRALFAYYSGRRLELLTEAASDPAALDKQLEKERRYYEAHLAMNQKRERGAVETLEAMERWGEVLSWNAVIRPSNRLNHREAHRQNWRPAAGPPVLTGAYPGTLPFCLCYSGAPVAGARMLV